jgi:hypothetical protein
MRNVISKDGTPIEFDQVGEESPLVLVGAMMKMRSEDEGNMGHCCERTRTQTGAGERLLLHHTCRGAWSLSSHGCRVQRAGACHCLDAWLSR